MFTRRWNSLARRTRRDRDVEKSRTRALNTSHHPYTQRQQRETAERVRTPNTERLHRRNFIDWCPPSLFLPVVPALTIALVVEPPSRNNHPSSLISRASPSSSPCSFPCRAGPLSFRLSKPCTRVCTCVSSTSTRRYRTNR